MHKRPATTYPDSVFSQTTEDETQVTEETIRFCTLQKDTVTRAETYTRIFPDGTTTALCIDGPATGSSSGHIALDSIGRIKFITGERTDNSPASGQLQMKTYGQLQQHLERSDIEYNAGLDEDNEALNIIAYGQVIENCIGHQRTIRGKDIYIEADDVVTIAAQTINLQANAVIRTTASSKEGAVVNEKDIVIGQKMTFGAGEETTMQFDPRASVNVISAGNINHKVLGDYKLTSLGCTSLFAFGGAGTLVKNRSVGMSVSTKTKFAAGGTASSELVSTGKVKIDSVAGVEIGADANVDITSTGNTSVVSGGLTEIDSSGIVDIKGTTVNIDGSTAVKISGQLIYLN